MSDIRLKKITIETSPLIIQNGDITILNTTISDSMLNGSLVSNGGISISSTYEASSMSAGGSLTVGGGVGVMKSIYIGKNLNMDTSNGIIVVGGVTENRMYLDNISNKHFYISPDGVNRRFDLYDSMLYINITTSSLNSSTGALCIEGGVSINTTENVTNSSNGGALTVAGGVGIGRNLRVGGNAVITESLTTGSFVVQNVNSTNITVSNTIITNTIITNATCTNLLATNITSSGLVVTNIDFTNATNTNLLATNITSSGLVVTDIVSTNVTNSNLLTTNITCTNSIISNLSVTSSTISNLVNTNVTVSNAILTNATITSITNSNLLNTALTSGGARITNDIYIGGDQYISGVANYTSDNDSVINLYDNLNFKRFSLDKNMSSHDFSVSRYDSLGNELEKTFGISYSTGVITFNNTIVSSSILSASMVVNGGISIKTSRSAQSESDGGALTIAGGVGVGSNLYIGGDVFMKSTTQSVDVSTGSLIIKGGVAISKNLNVLGNTLIFGNLTVNGLTTSIDTTNTVIKDNLLVLNSGPAGSNDSGIIITRYQQDNDTDSGDVVNTTDPLSIVIPAQTGMSSTQIKLNSSASEIDNYYTNWWVKVSSGFSNNQVRKITSYSGSTKIATISSSWTTQNPSGGDQLKIYNKPIVGLIFNELNDRFEFGSTVQDPGKTNVSFTDYMPITFASASSVSTSGSSSATSGSVLIAGGIGISNSTDAESITNGGTFTTLGGASIGKTLYCKTLNVNGVNMTPNSGDIFTSITFNASNNQTTPNDITNLSFSSLVWGFDCYLTARVVATTNLYTHFHIRGVNKGTDWEIIKTYVGNDTGIEFYITTGGQLQYTTPNISGFVSCTFKARALVN